MGGVIELRKIADQDADSSEQEEGNTAVALSASDCPVLPNLCPWVFRGLGWPAKLGAVTRPSKMSTMGLGKTASLL